MAFSEPTVKTSKSVKKKWVGGRYLATFSSNCFGISRNQVAEMVAAASLVATSGHPAQPKPTHFIYDLYDEIASVGQTILPPSRTFTARVSTPRLSPACVAPRGRRDLVSSISRYRAHPGLKSRADTGGKHPPTHPPRLRMTVVAPVIRLTRARLLNCQRTILQAVYPWGLGWSRRARAKSRVHRL